MDITAFQRWFARLGIARRLFPWGSPPRGAPARIAVSSPRNRSNIRAVGITTLIGLRDRALIGLMTYSFARVGAAVAMEVGDDFGMGKRWRVRLHEKGGKVHEMPAHHNLEASLDADLQAADLLEAKTPPLALRPRPHRFPH